LTFSITFEKENDFQREYIGLSVELFSCVDAALVSLSLFDSAVVVSVGAVSD